MSQENSQQFIQEDEIDLRELWKIIVKRKKIIIIFTLLVTLGSIVYVMMKNPIPVYSGNMMIEIGEMKSNNSNQVYLDNSYNLKEILERNFSVEVKIPKKTSQAINSILVITAENQNKNEIQNTLNTVKDFILNRHKEKVKLYDTYIMTNQVGDIQIGNQPINTPKKKLIVIVAFVTGLMLSVFLAFFLEFIKGSRKEEF